MALGPAQSLRQVGAATDPLGPGCPHWLLLGASVFLLFGLDLHPPPQRSLFQ